MSSLADLHCLSVMGILDGDFCGAPIGHGKKMCVKATCNVSLHRSKPKVSVEEFGGTDEQVFIEIPPAAGKTEGTTVYLTPRLLLDTFGTRFREYLHEKRTVDQ